MKNFTFAMKWHEILNPYSDDIRREVYDAIIEYVATGTIIEMQPLSRMAFDFIRYEIDEKAHRKEARLAKKQQTATPKNSGTDTETPVTEIPSTPEVSLSDADIITDEFMASGKAPEPFTLPRGNAQITINKELICRFVKSCVQDLLDKKTFEEYDDFISTLESLANRRIERVKEELMAQNPSVAFKDELWEFTIGYVGKVIRA